MSIRSLGRPLFAGLSPLALFAAPAFASGPVDHLIGVTAKRDPTVSALPDATAFQLAGLGDDFTFVTGGQFTELPNGKARLVGVLARIADPNKRFLADLTFDNRVDASDPSYPPAGSPMLDLLAPAYAGNGGACHRKHRKKNAIRKMQRRMQRQAMQNQYGGGYGGYGNGWNNGYQNAGNGRWGF